MLWLQDNLVFLGSILVVCLAISFATKGIYESYSANRKLRRKIHKERLEQEMKDAHLFGLRERLKQLMSLNLAKFATEQGVAVDIIEQKLDHPSVWQEYGLAGTDLVKLLAVGKKIRDVGGVPAIGGLDELWLETMNEVVRTTNPVKLYGFLEEYKGSFPCPNFEQKVVENYCHSTEDCLAMAPYFYEKGKFLCQTMYNSRINKCASECHTPREIIKLLNVIPVQQHRPAIPLDTNRAIHIVLLRLWQIYEDVIESATDYAQIENLELPDLETYSDFRWMGELHRNLKAKKDDLLTKRLRQAAGLE